jgi:hypothetical protein
MSKLKTIAIALGALIAVGAVGVGARRVMRGPSGATTEYGGALAATVVPEFTSQAADRWVNGAPTTLAAARGQVVLVEAWHPF